MSVWGPFKCGFIKFHIYTFQCEMRLMTVEKKMYQIQMTIKIANGLLELHVCNHKCKLRIWHSYMCIRNVCIAWKCTRKWNVPKMIITFWMQAQSFRINSFLVTFACENTDFSGRVLSHVCTVYTHARMHIEHTHALPHHRNISVSNFHLHQEKRHFPDYVFLFFWLFYAIFFCPSTVIKYLHATVTFVCN